MSGAVQRTPFYKILIANRGEIALRIMRTARRLGYGMVAVYSDADRDALHVREADQAVRIGGRCRRNPICGSTRSSQPPRPAAPSAVHPGYGFLAENAEFAQACRDAGLVFIGPSPEAIRAMGNKAGAKDDHAKGRRALRAGLSGRGPERRRDAGGGQEDRLSRDDQGRRRRRRARHAAGRGRGGISGALRSARSRGAGRLRRSHGDPGTRHRRAPPHRGPGVRRPPRQRHPSRRARLLGAAAAPEADRGSAVAGGDRRDAGADGRGRGRGGEGDPLRGRRHARIPARCRAATSTSWK